MLVKINPTKKINSTALSHHSFKMLNECPAKLGYYKMLGLSTSRTDAMQHGCDVHNMLASETGKQIREELIAPIIKGLKIITEFDIALNTNFKKTDYSNANFFRGRVDAGCFDSVRKKIWIFDWKTGKLDNADPFQMQTYAAYFQTIFKDWEVKAYLIKYPEGEIKAIELLDPADVWQLYTMAGLSYAQGRRTGYWEAKPGKHCEGCGALLECPIHIQRATQPLVMREVSEVLANVGTLPDVCKENLIPYLEAQYSLNLLYKAFKQATTNYIKSLKEPIQVEYKGKKYRAAYEATEGYSLRHGKEDVYNAAVALGVLKKIIKTADKDVEKAFADFPEDLEVLRNMAKKVKARRSVHIKEIKEV